MSETIVTIETEGPLLPAEFADLEPFARKWCLDNEAERYETRLGCTIDELQEFYDAALPRATRAMEYLDTFELYDLPPQELNLIHLMMSLIVCVFPVEAFRTPKVPDTGSTYLSKTIHPGP